MTTNEAGKQKEQSMTFTFKGPISWQWKEDKEKPYLSEFIVGCRRPPTIEAPNATRPAHEIDELITRHKATLDLLAKPAKSEPAECECVDKAKLLTRLEDRIKKEQAHEKKHAMHKVYGQAGASRERARALINLLREINARQFDSAPCKPEPAPEPIVSGEVIGSIGDGVTVKLDDGRIVTFRGQVQNPPGPAPSKPALDKGTVLDAFDRVFPHPELSGAKCIDLLRFCENVRCGRYDLPATDRPHEHKCRCSTANLVEMLRSRASLADGIDITDLDADQLLTVGWNRPATVIVVRKEDRS